MTALSTEEKDAIRRYMLRVVAIPGVLATVVAAVLGYLISEGHLVATERAYLEAYMTASDKMFEFINDVSSAVATAKQSKLQADIVLRDVQTIREELKTVESLTQTNALVDEIAATIIDQPAFRDKIKRSAPMPTYAIGSQ